MQGPLRLDAARPTSATGKSLGDSPRHRTSVIDSHWPATATSNSSRSRQAQPDLRHCACRVVAFDAAQGFESHWQRGAVIWMTVFECAA